MKEKEKQILDELNDADQYQLNKFMQTFDRIMLYNIAANTMPPNVLNAIVGIWDKVVKANIDDEATSKTEFLESHPMGRLAKYKGETDGESHRLESIKNWKLARKIIQANLKVNRNDSEDFDIDD